MPGIRVAMVVSSLRGGGLERLVRDLALGAAREGFEPRVFAMAGLGIYATDLEAAGIEAVDCSERGFRLRGVPLRLITRLNRFRPHVIHAHSGTWYAASVAKAVLRTPSLVYTEHGRYPPEPRIRAWVERACEAVTDCLCAVSGETASYLRAFLGLNYDPLVLPNGVDLGLFRPLDAEPRRQLRQELGLAESDVVAISVGRFVPVKNHGVIVEAAAPVMAAHPSLKVVFLGQGALQDEVKGQVARLGVESSFRFLGFRTDVAEWLAASDFFVNASTTEGQPVSILEAMASGLPVVATPVGGVPEVLGSPPAGILVPVNSVQAMSEAIQSMVASPAARGLWSVQAIERARSYSLESFLANHADLYRRLAGQAGQERERP